MSTSKKILLVEDDVIMTMLIQDLLKTQGYSVTVCASAGRAWASIQTDPEPFDLVLLDRGLPDLDGMDLLRQIKQDPAFAHTPVIFETGQSDHQSIREGLDNGAYYYLTKPFQDDVLLSVVHAALQQGGEYRELIESVRRAKSLLGLMHQGYFRFSDLDQARQLANNLACVCPYPEKAVQGLQELLVNAVEHGNLGISYADKSRLLKEGAWRQEVDRRLQLAEYRDRFVEVVFQRQTDSLCFTIQDQGNGFNWQEYLDFSPERAFDLHGRGIAMAGKISIDLLQYQGNGNTVQAIFKTMQPDPLAAHHDS